MARNTRLFLSLVVGVALATPTFADAQATRRGGSTGSGSSSGSAGSSGSSGSSGSTSSGSAGSSRSAGERRAAPPSSSGSASGAVRRGSPTSGGATAGRSGAATSRLGGSSGIATSATPSRLGLPGTAVRRPATTPAAVGLGTTSFAVERGRAGSPVLGYAADRPLRDVRVIYYPFVGPWGRWCPWYSSGFGWGGWSYVSYDPFYSSYYYRYPYGYPYNIYNRPTSPSIYGSGSSEPDELVGSIRFRANPDEALIYVNGALVGTIDDFNGLTDHLQLPAGVHQIEVRAEGYETYAAELTVEPGKTLTERFSLKKRQ